MPSLTPRELLTTVEGQWWTDGAQSALDVARDHWPEIAARSPMQAEDAETCRNAFLAAVRLGLLPESWVWRNRALVRYASVGWGLGAASVLQTDMHRALAAANDDYARGHTLDVIKPSRPAEAIIETLEPFARPDAADERFDFGPTPMLIARFYHERKALLALIDRRLDDAEAGFAEAAKCAENEPRGGVKVAGGVALVTYLLALDRGQTTGSALAATEQVEADAAARGYDDIRGWAAHNVAQMREGGVALRVYEML